MTLPQKPFEYHLSFVSDTEEQCQAGLLTLPLPPWKRG